MAPAIYQPSKGMVGAGGTAGPISPPSEPGDCRRRTEMTDTEKITINMGAVDLGKVDLLVREGVYSNRTDFIRTAIRNQIDKHHVEVQQSLSRYAFLIGILRYDRKILEKYR